MKIKRILSTLLAIVLVLGLLPASSLSVPAMAAAPKPPPPATITLKNADYGGYGEKTYESPNGLKNCHIHQFVMDAEGTEVYGFCYDHSLDMGPKYERRIPWSYDTDIAAGDSEHYPFLPFADWWINAMEATKRIDAQHTELTEQVKKERYAKDGYLTKFEQTWTNAWVQSSIWLAQGTNAKFNDCKNQEELKLVADERDAVLKAYGVNTIPGNSLKLLTDQVKAWEEGKYGQRNFYLYYPSDGKIQPILIPQLPADLPGNKPVYIKLLKESTDGKPLAGAQFKVTSKGDTQGVTITTGADGWGYVEVKLNFDETSRTFDVVETKAPPGGYTIDPTVYHVTADSAKNNTLLTAALVNGGAPIKNGRTVTDPPEGVVQKLDAETGSGVGPATFNFKGEDKDGGMVDADFTADADGSLDLQWSDPAGDDYIKPGQYTVTETIPPVGYELTTESQHLVLKLEWDEVTNAWVATSSGPIVFKNPRLHTVIIQKIGPNGGLPGAYFDVYRNGELLSNIGPTGPDGSIYFAGTAGDGLETGYYEFVETKAPNGYLIPFVHHQGVMVNAENTDVTTHQLTFVNEEYPEIIIQKVAAGTNERLEGAVFEVMIDGRNLGTIGPTGDNGLLRIDYDMYGKYNTTAGKGTSSIPTTTSESK